MRELPRGLYGFADAGFGDPLAQARLLAEEGVGVIQLRCKGWATARLLPVAVAAAGLGPLLVVDDDVEVARAVGAWVHLGQGDGPDPDLPFGRSCHALDQLPAAAAARYVGYGPVYPTATKHTGRSARGLGGLAAAVRASPRPVVAIGGITPENLGGVRAAGAHGWAVIGAIWTAADPRRVIREMR